MFFLLSSRSEPEIKPEEKKQNTAVINISGHEFRAAVASTPDEREKGLGYINQLPQDQAMIFLFDTPGFYGFWMKGMKISLDIIFINDRKIVDVFQDVKPPSEEKSNLDILKPSEPADKVLEINSGLSRKYNFKKGDDVGIKYD